MKKSFGFLFFGITSSLLFAQPVIGHLTKHEIESHNFRGMRKPDFNGLFILTSTSAKATGTKTVAVTLEFSTAVDPLSFNLDSVAINDEPLSKDIQLNFNRNGTKCCLYLTKEQMPVKIDLRDVHSFNGKLLHPLSTYIKLES